VSSSRASSVSSTSAHGKSTVLVTTDDLDELYYTTAILNSAVITAYFKEMYNSEAMAGGYINVKPGGIGKLPFVPYDPSNASHKKLVAAARELADAYRALSEFTYASNKFLYDMYQVSPNRTGDIIGAGFAKLRKRIKGLGVTGASDLHDWFTPKESEHRRLTDTIQEKEEIVSDLVAGLFRVRKLMALYQPV
jgi:hypothetical protein